VHITISHTPTPSTSNLTGLLASATSANTLSHQLIPRHRTHNSVGHGFKSRPPYRASIFAATIVSSFLVVSTKWLRFGGLWFVPGDGGPVGQKGSRGPSTLRWMSARQRWAGGSGRPRKTPGLLAHGLLGLLARADRSRRANKSSAR
jgi:hypothetical protein